MIKLERLFFRMEHLQKDVVIACTHNFIGQWQMEGFVMTGFVSVNFNESLMDYNARSIPTNLV